ncbi:MAG: hypothetical protein JNN24_05425 [Hyphomicrobium zavarzinii]|uniref:hypothetical protein n=1 Tax=Hyphomicrobium zavarzinii TaxID=48292 RepID=UPI001A639AFE|nr:hypothetical protein [Hyphomicrobium zavarzinii]MBL8845191.1 hypothetical protein [Hyphomicrobium zavarzinii]
MALALLCLPSLAIAQEGISGAFPFLSIDPSQLRSLKAAFLLQWQLFRGLNTGQEHDVAALYYIALSGTMVGALAVVFVRKLQETKIVLSWLLLVCVSLFAPFNSKLLFYPTVLKSEPEGLFVKEDPACDVSGRFVACGFTPQLAMAHVGTTIEVIFRDMFTSVGFVGLVDGAIASVALTNANSLNAGGSWLGDANDYLRSCAGNQIRPKALAEPTNTQGQDYTFPSAVRRIEGYYQGLVRSGMEPDFRTGAPAIVLDWEKNRNNAAYADAVGKLCTTALKRNHPANVLETCGVSTFGVVDAEVATKALLKQARDQNAVAPDPGSLTYYLRGANEQTNNGRSKVGACSGSSCGMHLKAAGWAYGDPEFATYSKTNDIDGMKMAPELLSLLKSFEHAPVSVWEYPTADGNGFEEQKTCSAERGDALFHALFDNNYRSRNASGNVVESEAGRPGMFRPLRDRLVGMTALPDKWKLEDITTINCDGWWGDTLTTLNSDSANGCKSANDLLKVLNESEYVKEGLRKAGSDIERRRLLADLFVSMVKPATGINAQSEASVEAGRRFGYEPSVIGGVHKTGIPFSEQTVGGFIAGFITSVSEALVSLGSKFIGPMSMAVLHFTRILIDMAMMMVIIVTPIIFLVGIAIPAHAAGILIQSVLIVGILKLVPVTFLIVDNLGGIIYRTFGAIGGDTDSLKKDMFIFAIAGMYMGIVTTTLFLLFKIGDVSNIQQLGQLDKAAKDIADVGRKAAIAIGTLVAGGSVGGALSAFGAIRRGKSGKEALAEAGKGAVDGAAALLPSSVKGAAVMVQKRLGGEGSPEEGEPEGPIDPDAPVDPNAPQPPAEDGESVSLASWQAAQSQWRHMHGGGAPSSAGDWAEIDQLAQSMDQGGGAINLGAADDAKRIMRSLTGRIELTAADMQVVDKIAGALQMGSLEAEIVASLRGRVGGQVGVPGMAAGVFPLGMGPGVAAPPLGSATTGMGTGTRQPGVSQASAPTVAPPQQATPVQAAMSRVDDDEQALRDRLAKLDVRISNMDELAQALRAEMPRVADAAAATLKAAEARFETVNIGRPAEQPGVIRSIGSGFVGGIMASGGMSKIPVLGDIIRSVADEYYEGPERAMAWKQAKGIRNWMRARSDARRKEFMEKEAATHGAGLQYQQMMSLGAGDAPWKIAQRAAAETVAKARDDRDAVRLAEADRGGRMLTGEDFRGANLISALQSLESGLQAAALQQKGTIQVGDGKVEVKLTPAVIKELVASKATKAMSATVDELMLGHVYLNEKDGRYGTGGRTRGDAAAIAKFVREDIGTDYQVGAFAKMYQGKEQFFRQQGIVKRFREDLAVEKVMLEKFKRDFPQATKAEVDAYKAKLPASRLFESSMQNGYVQMALGGYRAKFTDHVQELNDQKAQLAQMERQAKRYESQVGNILGTLQNYAMSANVPQDNVNVLSQALANVATSPHARAALARFGMDSAKKEYMLQVFANAGVDEQTLNQLRMML